MDFSSWLQSIQNIDTANGIWILAGAIVVGLFVLYILFASLRTFFAWLYRIDTVIRTQHDTNNILLEVLDTLENINKNTQKMNASIQKNTRQIKRLTKTSHFKSAHPRHQMSQTIQENNQEKAKKSDEE
ncbi:hypothetical protein CSB09_02990 [Candidatus Gracilibacteria bacterium]|nr:MAG: hypothetical protein CSB09_02990 [Candidatus Gracilibacteria bacterium]